MVIGIHFNYLVTSKRGHIPYQHLIILKKVKKEDVVHLVQNTHLFGLNWLEARKVCVCVCVCVYSFSLLFFLLWWACFVAAPLRGTNQIRNSELKFLISNIMEPFNVQNLNLLVIYLFIYCLVLKVYFYHLFIVSIHYREFKLSHSRRLLLRQWFNMCPAGTGNSRNWKTLTRKIHFNNSKFTLIFVNFRLG